MNDQECKCLSILFVLKDSNYFEKKSTLKIETIMKNTEKEWAREEKENKFERIRCDYTISKKIYKREKLCMQSRLSLLESHFNQRFSNENNYIVNVTEWCPLSFKNYNTDLKISNHSPNGALMFYVLKLASNSKTIEICYKEINYYLRIA